MCPWKIGPNSKSKFMNFLFHPPIFRGEPGLYLSGHATLARRFGTGPAGCVAEAANGVEVDFHGSGNPVISCLVRAGGKKTECEVMEHYIARSVADPCWNCDMFVGNAIGSTPPCLQKTLEIVCKPVRQINDARALCMYKIALEDRILRWFPKKQHSALVFPYLLQHGSHKSHVHMFTPVGEMEFGLGSEYQVMPIFRWTFLGDAKWITFVISPHTKNCRGNEPL